MLNKQAYVRMCMLELGKVIMYEFHYDYIENKCGNISRLLLLTDPDSLMYEIETENVYDDFSKKCLILITILLSQNITMIQIHYLLVKQKMKWVALLLLD